MIEEWIENNGERSEIMKKIDLHVHTIATSKDSDFVFDIDKMQLYVQIS